jgi:hypothetical protein
MRSSLLEQRLRKEDLAKGHVPEVEGGPVGDGCIVGDSRGDGNAGVQAGKSVRYNVRCTWCKH